MNHDQLCETCPYSECIRGVCWVYRFLGLGTPEERKATTESHYNKYIEFETGITPAILADEVIKTRREGYHTSVFVEANKDYAITCIAHPFAYRIYPHHIGIHRLLIIPPDIPAHTMTKYIGAHLVTMTEGLREWNRYRIRSVCESCSDASEAEEKGVSTACNVCEGCQVQYFRQMIDDQEGEKR